MRQDREACTAAFEWVTTVGGREEAQVAINELAITLTWLGREAHFGVGTSEYTGEGVMEVHSNREIPVWVLSQTMPNHQTAVHVHL